MLPLVRGGCQQRLLAQVRSIRSAHATPGRGTGAIGEFVYFCIYQQVPCPETAKLGKVLEINLDLILHKFCLHKYTYFPS